VDGQVYPRTGPVKWTSDPNKRKPVQKLTLLIPSRSANSTPFPEPEPKRASSANARCVRWDENLITPSPIQRRKGWFNRKG
jgi:hypothetical protein